MSLCMHVYSYEHVFVLIVDTRELLNGESDGLLKLPTDLALVEDPEFRKFVDLYAKVIWVLDCFSSILLLKIVGQFITAWSY